MTRTENSVGIRAADEPNPSVEVERLREALEPFAAFAVNVDQQGWTSNIHREGISVWFGPSDFQRARAALSHKQEPGVPTPGGEGE